MTNYNHDDSNRMNTSSKSYAENLAIWTAKQSTVEKVREWQERITLEETTACTTATRKRISNAKKLLADLNFGTFGKLEELFSCSEKSRKTSVSKQGQTDTFIKWMSGNGKHSSKAVERKTNGGRVQDCINKLASGKDSLIVYSMDICNASTSGQRRIVEPIVMRFSAFYSLLVSCNALKNTNGANPQLAIQASSKLLYKRLLEYPIPYDANATYSDNDFNDIEI